MVIPALMLTILALVVMRALMGVVAHDDAAPTTSSRRSEGPVPGLPAPQLRTRADDGVRAFLLPAAEPDLVDDPAAQDHPTASRR